MATTITAYETTQKLATGANENITSTPVSGSKRALDVYIRGGGGGGGGGTDSVSNGAAGGNGARGEIWVYEFF